ncbi:MAG: globin domain-containing protein [Pseudomonadota bacterium]
MTQIEALNASLEVVAERCEDVVPPVYAAFFQRYPKFEELFVNDIDHGVRGHMLNEALGLAEGLLEDDTLTYHFVSSLRMNHEGYGIENNLFEEFYEVIADVFQTLAGEAWTPAMSSAWSEVVSAAAKAKL